MSFRPEFQDRWTRVIEPGIREAGLRPHRVDASRISDSIITEILSAIGKARLIFGDISVDTQNSRNGNVMYEVGIAHAMRQPQEVVLFRSDDERLLFDVSNIRVNRYDPGGAPATSKERVKDALLDALRELDLTKNLAVRRALGLLDTATFVVLLEAVLNSRVSDPPLKTMGQAVGNMPRFNAIRRLVDLGLLRVNFQFPADLEHMSDAQAEQVVEALEYRPTELGECVAAELQRQIDDRKAVT